MPTSRQNTNARSVFRSCFSFLQAAVMIVKNGNMVATVWAESIPYWATASNVAVLSLEKGDQVSTERERESESEYTLLGDRLQRSHAVPREG